MTHDIKSEEGTHLECQENITVARSRDDRRARPGGEGRFMRFLVKSGGAIAVVASMALAGCIAQEGDEALSDEALSDEALSDEATGEAEQAIQLAFQSVTCYGGWPGERDCFHKFVSATDIVPGTVAAQVEGRNGALGYSAFQSGPRTIDFWATIHEGDIFNPGKNTTNFLVFWVRQ